jgi:hypothetical protein
MATWVSRRSLLLVVLLPVALAAGLLLLAEVVVVVEAMTRLGCQWMRQPIAALPSPVAEAMLTAADWA